jgi:hypothetical protein
LRTTTFIVNELNKNLMPCLILLSAVPVALFVGVVSQSEGGSLAVRPGMYELRMASTNPTNVASTPDDSLRGISCTSRENCVAGGVRGTSVYHVGGLLQYDGERWTPTANSSLNKDQNFIVAAVSCPGPRACEVVNGALTQPFRSETLVLALRWDGSSWSWQGVPVPLGTISAQILGVSCASVNACEAVGDYITKGFQDAFAVGWNGKTWHYQLTPGIPGGSLEFLRAVSCPSPDDCEAVGDYQSFSALGPAPLAEIWDGQSWRVQPSAELGGTEVGNLFGVSCVSTGGCEAVGAVEAGPTTVLVEKWDGHSWARQAAPLPPTGDVGQLYSVSCSDARHCEAVGSGEGLGDVPFALGWDGDLWERQHLAPGVGGGDLYGVSCPATNYCEAIGDAVNAGGHGLRTVAEAWTGAQWDLQTTSLGS